MTNTPDQKQINVTAYSGYKANERPLTFVINDTGLKVTDILDRWYGEESDYFKVLADDGEEYLLRWHRTLDQWTLVGQKKWRTLSEKNHLLPKS